MVCKNCTNIFEGNYCNECGQSAAEERLTFKNFKYDLRSKLIPVGNGGAAMMLRLLVKPVITIQNYINCKRKDLVSPFPLLIGMIALYFIIGKLWYVHSIEKANESVAKMPAGVLKDIMTLYLNNIAFFEILFILPMSFFLWLIFRNKKFNYIEHLYIYCYIICICYLYKIIVAIISPLTSLFINPSLFNKILLFVSIPIGCMVYSKLLKNKYFDVLIYSKYLLAIALNAGLLWMLFHWVVGNVKA